MIPLRCWNNSIRFFARRGESIFVHAVLLMVCVQRDILLGKFLQATEFLLQAKIFRYDNVHSLSKDVSSSVESFWGWTFVEKNMTVWANYRLSNYSVSMGKTWCIFPSNPAQQTQLRSQNRKTSVIPHLLDAYKNCDCTAWKTFISTA